MALIKSIGDNEICDQTCRNNVSNMNIGGTNLLVGTASGSGWGYSTFDKSTRTFTRSTTSTSECFIKHDNVKLEPNKTYTLSADVWSNGKVSSCDFFFYDANVKSPRNINFIPSTTAQRKSWTFTVPNTSDNWSNATIRFDNNGSITSGTAAILYIRDVKLEKGNKPTDWSPSPYDTFTMHDDGAGNITMSII